MEAKNKQINRNMYREKNDKDSNVRANLSRMVIQKREKRYDAMTT